LRKLDVIHRARAGILHTRQPFQVHGRFDDTTGVLTLTSNIEPGDSPAEDLPLRPDRVTLLIWDHSMLGHQVSYVVGRGRWLTASIGPGGVHRFDAIAELLRLRPADVWPSLSSLLGSAAAPLVNGRSPRRQVTAR
jgi:hypothetical protein